MAHMDQSLENSKTWIADEKYLHETRDYGKNQRAVGDALDEQKRRVTAIHDYSTTVRDLSSKAKDEKQAKDLNDSYSELQTIADRRLECLETLNKVDSLESAVNVLSSEFGRTATALSKREGNILSPEDAEAQANWEGIPRLSQEAILALRKNWQNLQLMLKLADAHLINASAYHQFHHDAEQYKKWMPVDIARVGQLVQFTQPEDGKISPEETAKLLDEIREVQVTLQQWQRRLEELFDKSKKIVPVHLRVEKVDHALPVIAMCDYQTKEITITDSEELKVTDNSDSELWKVQNMHGTRATVPSIICLVPAPDTLAIRKSAGLRLQLLKAWTDELKRIGKQLIAELNALLQNWLEDDAKKLRALPNKEKRAISDLLDTIEDVLPKHWSKYPSYQQLQNNIEKVRDALADNGDQKNHDPKAAADSTQNSLNAKDSLNNYKDLVGDWEVLKILAESGNAPEELLSLDDLEPNFEQLNDAIKKRNPILGVGEEGVTDRVDSGEEVIEEIVAPQVMAAVESAVVDEFEEGVEEEVITIEETMETEELVHSEQEEKRTFVITGVVDTSNDSELSMADAIEQGIISQEDGMYQDKKTGEKIPIAEAMSRGLIKVEFSVAKKSEEKRRDVGLITVTTKSEARSVTIKGATDPQTGKKLSLQEAQDKGVIDLKRQCYHNTETGDDTPLADAIANGLIFVDNENGDPESQTKEAEVVTKTFAVYSVVDQKKKSRVPFSEAVKQQLLDKETGVYWHNVTGDKVPLAEAIQKGFIKASEVADPSSMDIAMENTAVTEKFDKLRKRLVNPISALGAMAKMANSNKTSFGAAAKLASSNKTSK